jgi:hypothetical protein
MTEIAPEGMGPTRLILEQAEECARHDPSRESDERWRFIRELHRRGERPIFEAAVRWCGSDEPLVRCLGADVLAQLGFSSDFPYARESEAVLVTLLDDPDQGVLGSALTALGHLGVGRTDLIARKATHASPDVRYSVAYCLGTRDEPIARDTLVLLSRDSDSDVRDWATFGLGSLSEVDSDMIRAALVERLSDRDDETRGEAMVGLAVRGDPRAIPAILDELQGDDVMSLAIEAASELRHPGFLPLLNELSNAHPDDAEIRQAVERCRSSPVKPSADD